MKHKIACFLFGVLLLAASSLAATIQTPSLRFQLSPDTGRYEITDLQTNVAWQSNPNTPRFGQVVLNVNGQRKSFDLARCELKQTPSSFEAAFQPLPDKPDAIRITIAATGKSLNLSYAADPGLTVESLRLLDDAFAISAADNGYLTVPVREGLLIPANSNIEFTKSFGTYEYEGCHMTMLGLVKRGSAALITWTDPYVTADVKSTLPKDPAAKQTLSLSLSLRKSAKSCTITLLGNGDYVTIAKAYRQIAKDKGYLVTWDQKLKENPRRAALFGAINFKLWSTLSRKMNDESTQEQRVTVGWTFDEVGQVAEHLKTDLKLDRVHFIIGGWIHRGYDNQHPDILPAAPECGGNDALAAASRKVRSLGYIFDMHDNYQDIYKDAPSWNEEYIQKNPDGSLVKGGQWDGGRAYLTCSQKALELAQRPQNLLAVKKLTDADSYFIDTTYAVGLQECFDPKHPLTRADDMKWKQAISDYARSVFGIFGSECGREWAIPHADYFEGLTGVSGTYYHMLKPETLGATVIPLFELVYRDCISLYGKYGYDINSSAEYVLHHISIGRTLNYHSIPSHLYWKDPTEEPLPIRPSVAELKQTGPRQFAITYRWDVAKPPSADWNIFVHFTDSSGQIKFQDDHTPKLPTSVWPADRVLDGPFTVTVPQALTGTFDIRIGMFEAQADRRILLQGRKDRDRRCIVGQLKINGEKVEFIAPATPNPDGPSLNAAMYVRADNGWAAGMHPVDRYVKNTYEILSPLHEITAQMQMTNHHALTPDRKVRQTLFGDGASIVNVIANGSGSNYRTPFRGSDVILPPNGFLIESPTFVAFCATQWNGIAYDTPTCFTLRSLDGKPLEQSEKVRIFHAFGDPRIKFGNSEQKVDKEATLGRKE